MDEKSLIEELRASTAPPNGDGGIALAEQFGRSLSKAGIGQFIALSAAVMAQYRQQKKELRNADMDWAEVDLLIAAAKVLKAFGME